MANQSAWGTTQTKRVRGSNIYRKKEMHTKVAKATPSDADLTALAQERSYNAITDVCRAAPEGSPLRLLIYSERMKMAEAVAARLSEDRMLY